MKKRLGKVKSAVKQARADKKARRAERRTARLDRKKARQQRRADRKKARQESRQRNREKRWAAFKDAVGIAGTVAKNIFGNNKEILGGGGGGGFGGGGSSDSPVKDILDKAGIDIKDKEQEQKKQNNVFLALGGVVAIGLIYFLTKKYR